MTQAIVDEDVAWLATRLAPDADEILREMDDRAEREGFPHVGPTVGGWLALFADLVDARRAFEFGSGFGYSAYWIARELPADGEVVLTEVDADELALAREYFDESGLADRARFEGGDALDAIGRYDGPFDLVLIDHEKERYVEAFEAVRSKVAPGGVVLADNAVTAGSIDPSVVRALLAGEDRPDASESSRGIAEYVARVGDDPDFRSALLPFGEGVAVSRKR